MFKRTLLGVVSAIMLIAAVVLSGCGSSDPMLGKWIVRVPVASELGTFILNIEKNGDDKNTRVVSVSAYGYENQSTAENRNKNELLMVWKKNQVLENRGIYPCSNNIIQLPLGTIAYDQNRKSLLLGGSELKRADEKTIKEMKAVIQKNLNTSLVGRRVPMPNDIWNMNNAYVVKTIIFKDAAAK